MGFNRIPKKEQANIEDFKGTDFNRIKSVVFLVAFIFIILRNVFDGNKFEPYMLLMLVPFGIIILFIIIDKKYPRKVKNSIFDDIFSRYTAQKDGVDKEVDKIMDKMESDVNYDNTIGSVFVSENENNDVDNSGEDNESNSESDNSDYRLDDNTVSGKISTDSKLSKSASRRFARMRDKKYVARHSVSLQKRSRTSKKYWFKSKSFGYGWTPCSREGWAITLLFTGVMIGLPFLFAKELESGKVPVTYLVSFIGSILLLIYIAYKTGEKPKFDFGNSKKTSHSRRSSRRRKNRHR